MPPPCGGIRDEKKNRGKAAKKLTSSSGGVAGAGSRPVLGGAEYVEVTVGSLEEALKPLLGLIDRLGRQEHLNRRFGRPVQGKGISSTFVTRLPGNMRH